MKRVRYTISLMVASRAVDEVIIDQHYKIKHSDLSDWIILELVRSLDLRSLNLDFSHGPFSYYVVEPVFYKNKPYRLILVLEEDSSYVGVINAFRVQGKKYGISK